MTNDRDRATVGRTREASTPSWAARPRARPGAPNVVIVYMDDMGWSDPGCYGSEIDTPNIDAIAARGVRMTHYTTHPLCSPARAALLTGCNAHAVGTGWLAMHDAGFPGYSARIPRNAATLPETLREAGYETIMVGKWHNNPAADTVPGGSKASWPTQRGFDTFYGFMDGETHHHFPSRLMLNNQLLPIDEYPPDYYAGDDWMTQAIGFIKDLRASDPGKPFFLYVANNAVHSPLQAKPSDLARYAGRYDGGWTAARHARHRRQIEMGLVPASTRLPPSDPRARDWSATDPANRALYARHMETYAAMLDNADQNVGRLVDLLVDLGELENTIILFSSDNGGTDSGGEHGKWLANRSYGGLAPPSADAERRMTDRLGGPASAGIYPTAWGEVSNTPFPTFKTYTGGGGRRVSFVASWPAGIAARGAIRTQFMHVTDVMPTILELAGVSRLNSIDGQPSQSLDGKSCAAVLVADAASPRDEQYYECWSNRAFYRRGWLARSIQARGQPIDMDNWTLHDLEHDFSESSDVAADHPETLAELVDAFDRAAWDNHVYPLDNRSVTGVLRDFPADLRARADLPRRFLPGAQTAHRHDIVPLIADRTFRVTARVLQREGDEGVLWAIGDTIAGVVAYVEAGCVHVHYNGFGETRCIEGVALQAGLHDVQMRYEALGGRRGRGCVAIDDVPVSGWRDLSPTLTFGFFEGLDVGLDRRAPVSWDLRRRHGVFRYTGSITSVVIEPGPRAVDD